jgi:MFS family permease
MGFGLPFAFVPVSIAALAGVESEESGLASGLINTAQQIGGAVGVAVASSIAISHFNHLVASGQPPPVALTSGYQWAFWVMAGLGIAGLVASILLIRSDQLQPAPEAIRATA